MDSLLQKENFFRDVLGSIDESLVLLDCEMRIMYMNSAAERALELESTSYIGKNFKDLDFGEYVPKIRGRLIEGVLESGKSQKGVVKKTITNKVISVNAVPIYKDNVIKGIVITGKDVTELVTIRDELDLAFALTLPDDRVKHKLKNTVEYIDQYDPESKMITITDIIPDGGYRHVVNCLKLLSSLCEEGVTQIIGINKEHLIQAIIFHDLCKVQPVLSIGDVVDPKKLFEDGKLHAFRGAEMAKKFYSLHEDVVEIIRYHHHAENELPDTFPWYLKPMFRLFCLIDGLSASITRGGGEVEFKVHHSTITVTERNNRPQYNGTWEIEIISGERTKISD
ncbi:HD domain-containing protein [Domibacillus epiphyticus]|uniref:PAS domain-containing protein n=1 Tax=Domibacillus epiphyticus TaxID=1714355 RepID=A0A1V2ACN3_9BACI|nr:HD domain-containing protein [Domibacillus epiphyticus]OMP68755.1 hypothetical protein BTO28_01535 [Domibacillus epiphyticus]